MNDAPQHTGEEPAVITLRPESGAWIDDVLFCMRSATLHDARGVSRICVYAFTPAGIRSRMLVRGAGLYSWWSWETDYQGGEIPWSEPQGYDPPEHPRDLAGNTPERMARWHRFEHGWFDLAHEVQL